jgi:mutator protein MutT
VIHVVAAVILDNRRVLIAQRASESSNPLLWELPGGKVEPNESPRQALARELREELGIRARVGALLGECTHRYPHESIRLEAYWVSHIQGEPQALHHTQLAWVRPEHLGRYRFTGADVPLVHEVIKSLPGS